VKAWTELSMGISQRSSEVLVGALRPEVGSSPEGTYVRIGRTPEGLSLIIESEDLASHRAALNSYLGLLHAALGSLTTSGD